MHFSVVSFSGITGIVAAHVIPIGLLMGIRLDVGSKNLRRPLGHSKV